MLAQLKCPNSRVCCVSLPRCLPLLLQETDHYCRDCQANFWPFFPEEKCNLRSQQLSKIAFLQSCFSSSANLLLLEKQLIAAVFQTAAINSSCFSSNLNQLQLLRSSCS